MNWPPALIEQFLNGWDFTPEQGHTKEETIKEFLDAVASRAAWRCQKWGNGQYAKDIGITGAMVEAYFQPYTPIGFMTANCGLCHIQGWRLGGNNGWNDALEALQEFVRENAAELAKEPPIPYDDHF